MAACPVPNPFEDQQLTGLNDQCAERIRRAVEIWCRGERLRLSGDYLEAIRVFREAGLLGLLLEEGRSQEPRTFPHPRVVANGLSGELLMAVRDAINEAAPKRAEDDDREA